MTKRGQSIIEYSLIAVLIILGIVFMGPYVLRSINGHFRLWDVGVQDSFEENLGQAPLNVIPFLNGTCECTLSTGNCGSSVPGAGGCAPDTKEMDYNCIPQGCNGGDPTKQNYCNPDPSCCSCPQPGDCGTAPFDANYPPTTPTPCPTQNNNSGSCPGLSSTTCYSPASSTISPCYYGYQIWSYQCGSSSPVICVPNTYDPITNPSGKCPLPQCSGYILFPGSTIYCATGTSTPPTSAQAPGLVSNTNTTYVTTGVSPQALSANCPASPTCQAYCVPPYEPDVPPPNTSTCVLKFTVAANSCCAKSNFPINDPSNPCSASCVGATSNCHVCSCTPPSPPSTCPADQWINTVNDQSFTACAASSTIVSSLTLTPYGATATASPGIPISATISGGCSNPGEPGQGCAVSVKLGPN